MQPVKEEQTWLRQILAWHGGDIPAWENEYRLVKILDEMVTDFSEIKMLREYLGTDNKEATS